MTKATSDIPVRPATIHDVPPGVDDDFQNGFIKGDVWIDQVGLNFYVSVKDTNGAAVWDSGGGLSELFPYLVGPLGVAPYQNIQDAIDAAKADGATWANQEDVRIISGTYTEDLLLSSGVNLLALNLPVESGYKLVDSNQTMPHIIGTHSIRPVKSAATRAKLAGLKFTYAGSEAIFDQATKDTFVPSLDFYRCWIDHSGSGDLFSSGQGLIIFAKECVCLAYGGENVFHLGEAGAVSDSFVAYDCVLDTGGSYVFDVSGTSIKELYVVNRNSDRADGGTDDQAYLWGTIRHNAGATNLRLRLDSVEWYPGAASHAEIEGTLQNGGASSWFHNTYDNDGNSPFTTPITISGANGSQWSEAPRANSGEIWRFDGQQWQITPESLKYVVGPSGSGAPFNDLQTMVTAMEADTLPQVGILLPGVYTGNVTITKPGVHLQGFTQGARYLTNDESTVIVGNVTYTLSGGTGSICSFSGIVVDGVLSITGSQGTLLYVDESECRSATSTPVVLSNSDGLTRIVGHSMKAEMSAGTAPAVSLSGGSSFDGEHCEFSRTGNHNATCIEMSGGSDGLVLRDCRVNGRIVALDGSKACNITGATSSVITGFAGGSCIDLSLSSGIVYLNGCVLAGQPGVDVVEVSSVPGKFSYANVTVPSGLGILDSSMGTPVETDGVTLLSDPDSGGKYLSNNGSYVGLAAHQTELLVGPSAGTAPYTAIQDAINAASSGDTVWVLPGTYTGDITPADGVNIRAVVNQKHLMESATIVGRILVPAFWPVGLTIHGMKLAPPDGSDGIIAAPDAFQYSIVNLIDVSITTKDAPCLNLTKGSGIFLNVSLLGCSLYRLYSAVTGPAVIADGAALSTNRSSYSGKTGANTVAIDLSGDGSLYVGPGEDELDIIWGKIDVSAGSNNELHLRGVRMDVDSGDHVTVTGNLSAGKGLYRDAVDADTEEPITIGGVNAADLVAVPSSMELETLHFRSPASPPSYLAGRVFYDDGALTLGLMTGRTDVVNQIGQEIHALVYNDSGDQIDNGEVVYRTGSASVVFPDSVSRRVPTVDLAKADQLSTSLGVAGMATEDIPNGSLGMITSFGIVRGLNTTGLSYVGPLYLSAAIAGAVTNTKPAAPNRVIVIGGLIELSGSTGKINVDIDRTALDRPLITRSYSFTSQGIGSGTFFIGGFYRAPSSATTRTQAATSITLGSANEPHASHAFAVAAGAGTVDTGQVGLRVTGTSYQDDGTRTTSDSEVLTDDITTLSLNDYLETSKKWLGVVTWELFVVSGVPTAYSLTFNYGFAKYDDIDNRDFYVLGIECVGLAGASDSGFNIELLHHKFTGWTYSAGAFVPGDGAIASMSTDMGPDDDIINGEHFAWKDVDLATFVCGNDSEGCLIRITTGNPNSIQSMDLHMLVAADPKP